MLPPPDIGILPVPIHSNGVFPVKTHPSSIVRSNPFNDIQPFIDFLWTTDPALCRSVFTDLFPRGINGLGASQEEEDAFILQHFDEACFNEHGPRFLKTVLYHIAVYNDGRVIEAAQRFERDNEDLFANELNIKELMAKTTLHEFFTDRELILYHYDELLLNRVRKAVKHKIRWMRQRSLSLHPRHQPNFMTVDYDQSKQIPTKEELISPGAAAKTTVSTQEFDSSDVLPGATEETVEDDHSPTTTEGESVILPSRTQSLGLDITTEPSIVDSVAIRKARSLPGPAKDTRFMNGLDGRRAPFVPKAFETQTSMPGRDKVSEPQQHSQISTGTQTKTTQLLPPAQPREPRPTTRDGFQTSVGDHQGRRGSMSSKGSLPYAKGRGRGTSNGRGQTQLHRNGSGGQENRPFLAPYQSPFQQFRRTNAPDGPRTFDHASILASLADLPTPHATQGYHAIPSGTAGYSNHNAGAHTAQQFTRQPDFERAVSVHSRALPQMATLGHQYPTITDEVVIWGLPCPFPEREVSEIIKSLVPGYTIASIEVTSRGTLVRSVVTALEHCIHANLV